MSEKKEKIIAAIPLILGLTGIVIFAVSLILEFTIGADAWVFYLYMPVCIFAVGIVSAIIIGIRWIIKRKSIKIKTGTKIIYICGIIILFIDLAVPGILIGIFYLLLTSGDPNGLADFFETAIKGTTEIMFPDNQY